MVSSVHCADRWRLGGRGEESVTLRAEKKREKEGKKEKKVLLIEQLQFSMKLATSRHLILSNEV